MKMISYALALVFIMATLGGCAFYTASSRSVTASSQSAASSSSSGGMAVVTTNYTFLSCTTNSLGTNGLSVSYFTLTDVPVTWFSNFVVTNSASFPFVVTNRTNVLTNGFQLNQIVTVSYFTNVRSGSTNRLDFIPVAFSESLRSTNIWTNGLSVSYFTISDAPATWFSNMVITNSGSLAFEITTITNASTNGSLLYAITNLSNETNFSSASTNPVAFIPVDFEFDQRTTNYLGTNGLSVSYFTLSDSPATWFSNFVATNAGWFPFIVIDTTNALTNSMLLYTTSNIGYYTNTSGPSSNFLDYVPVDFAPANTWTNFVFISALTDFVIIGDSNFLVSNIALTMAVTNVTNAQTNGLTIYALTNGMETEITNYSTNWCPEWRKVGDSAGFSSGAVFGNVLKSINGIPYIAYENYSNSKVKGIVQYYSNDTWNTLGTDGIAGSEISFIDMAVENGIPYVTYADYDNNRLAAVMVFSNNTWTNVGPEFGPGQVYYTRLAFHDGIPYVAFLDVPHAQEITVMYYSNSQWTNLGDVGRSPSSSYNDICFRFNNGMPYIAFQDSLNGEKASVTFYSNETWQYAGTPGFSPANPLFMDLECNNGYLYLAFQDNANDRKATVMMLSNNVWNVVGQSGFSPAMVQSLSLEFQNGNPYVSFMDDSNFGKASVMTFSNGVWTNVGKACFSEGFVSYTSLAFVDGHPFVSYQDGQHSQKLTVMKFK